MTLWLPKRPSGQPSGRVQIDWTNRYARSLVVAQVGRQVFNCSGEVALETSGAGPEVREVQGEQALSATSDISTAFLAQLGASAARIVERNNTITQITRFRATSASGSWASPFQIWAQNDWSSPYTLGVLRRNTSNDWMEFLGPSGTNDFQQVSFELLPFLRDNFETVAFTRNGTAFRAFLDGALVETNTGSAVSSITYGRSDKKFGFLQGSTDGNETLRGEVALTLYFDRTLSDEEVADVSANPWQLFKPVLETPLFAPAAAGGTNVSATTKALTLATQQASVANDVEVTAGPSALTLTTNAATVSLDKDVSANTSALTLATQQASLTYDVEVTAGPSALTLTPQAATIANDVNVGANAAALTLTPQAASVALGVNVLTSPAALTVTTYPASVAYDVEVTAGPASLTLTPQAATIIAAGDIPANTAALTLATHQAAIGYDKNVSANVISLNLATARAGVSTADESFQQPGGWLPKKYVDREGNIVDLDAVEEEIVEAVEQERPKRPPVKTVRRVFEALSEGQKPRTSDLTRIRTAIQREKQALDLLNQTLQAVEREKEQKIARRKRQIRNNGAVALLLAS